MSNHRVKVSMRWLGSWVAVCRTCKTIGRTSTRAEARRVAREHATTHRKDPPERREAIYAAWSRVDLEARTFWRSCPIIGRLSHGSLDKL